MASNLTTCESMTVGSGPGASEGIAVSEPTVLVGNTSPAHGSKHLEVANPGTASGVTRWAVSGRLIEAVFDLQLTSIPPGEMTIGELSATGDAVRMCLQITVMPTTGYLRLRTRSTTRWTSTFNVCDGVHRRIGLYGDAGTSGSDGAARLAVFTGDSQTASGDSTLISGIDIAGTSGGFGNLRLGKSDSNNYTGTIRLDSIYWANGGDATQNFLPYTPAASSTFKALGGFLTNAGGWTIEGGSANVETALNDASASTGIVSAGAGTDEVAGVRLTTPTLTGTVAWEFDLSIPSGSTATSAKVEIMQGLGSSPTVIATRTFGSLTTTPAAKTVTLTSGEKAAITLPGQLWVRITGNPA